VAGKRKMTRKQAGKKGNLVKKGLPKNVAHRIATGKPAFPGAAPPFQKRSR